MRFALAILIALIPAAVAAASLEAAYYASRAAYIKKFGFGVATGIQQAGEATGQVNPPSNASGNNINYANMSFGQGVSVTHDDDQ